MDECEDFTGQLAHLDQQLPPPLPPAVHSPQDKLQNNTVMLLETALQLFKLVEEENVGSLEQRLVISDQLLLALHSIFQQSLLVQALELMELGKVTSYVCYGQDNGPSRETHQCLAHSSTMKESKQGRRQLFLVDGNSGNRYLCFSTCMYCSCPSFVYSVLARGESLMCKHLLASCLATALQHCSEVVVTDREWTRLAGGQGSHPHTH